MPSWGLFADFATRSEVLGTSVDGTGDVANLRTCGQLRMDGTKKSVAGKLENFLLPWSLTLRNRPHLLPPSYLMKMILLPDLRAISPLLSSLEPTNVAFKAPYWNCAFHCANQQDMYHRCLAYSIARESNILPLPGAILGGTRPGVCDMLRWGRFPHFRDGWVRPPENGSEISLASSSPKRQAISLGMI